MPLVDRDKWLEFVVKALATWRISHMFVKEEGPWYVFRRIREHEGWQYDIDGQEVAKPTNHVLGCIWCLSPWVGILLSRMPMGVVTPFALSAVTIALQKWFDED